MEHAVMSVCIQMQSQTVLCYSCTDEMEFIKSFLKIKHKLYIASGLPPPAQS